MAVAEEGLAEGLLQGRGVLLASCRSGAHPCDVWCDPVLCLKDVLAHDCRVALTLREERHEDVWIWADGHNALNGGPFGYSVKVPARQDGHLHVAHGRGAVKARLVRPISKVPFSLPLVRRKA